MPLSRRSPPRFLCAVLACTLFPLLLVAVVGGAAGRFDLPFVWAVAGLLGVYSVVTLSVIDPALAAERLRPAPGSRDARRRRLLLPCVFAQWTIAGLDLGRVHWSDGLPPALQGAALAVLAAALGLASWAMAANPFFSCAVRIQDERGHRVVTGG